MISLHKHDLLRNILALFEGTEANETSQARVRLLVSMCHTHSSSNGHVEALQRTVFTSDGNETNIIREDINIIGWWNSYCDFELEMAHMR